MIRMMRLLMKKCSMNGAEGEQHRAKCEESIGQAMRRDGSRAFFAEAEALGEYALTDFVNSHRLTKRIR